MGLADIVRQLLSGGEVEITLTREKITEKALGRRKLPHESGPLTPQQILGAKMAQVNLVTSSYDRELAQKVLEAKISAIDPNCFSLGKVNNQYYVVLTDDVENNPFIIDQNLARLSVQLTQSLNEPEAKARALYHWVQSHIDYDKNMEKGTYRNSLEVFSEKKGVCGSMAFLYISMARNVGLSARYASVKKDFKGDKVRHGCAVVALPSRSVLVDPAYNMFDAKHKLWIPLTDNEAVLNYRSWRGKK
jgi:transglutaminase-like putative cysteine protease